MLPDFKTPIEYMKEALGEIIKDFADAAFEWLNVYMMEPTDFSNGYFGDASYIIFPIAMASVGIMFGTNMIKHQARLMAGDTNRSADEILIKTLMGIVMTILLPFAFTMMIKINNVIVSTFLGMGVDVETLVEFLSNPTSFTLSMGLMGVILSFLLIVLSIQYILRYAELAFLFVLSPIAAVTNGNEELNILPAWWRESVSTIFTQAFQVFGLWIALNSLGNMESLKDVIGAVGTIAILITGPGFLRRLLYSSGAGRTVTGAAGGASKFAVMKFMAKKLV